MKNRLHEFTKWIICLFAITAYSGLSAQTDVRDEFCDYAIDVDCGQIITNETTDGAPNTIWEYALCNNYTFSGPEKVYKFTTDEAGTIQVDLTIHAADLDIDILLVSDDCSEPLCLAQSITSNRDNRFEQIIYNEAEANTSYYLIVDSEKDVGAYDLTILCNPNPACGLEFNAVPIPLSCGGTTGTIGVDIVWGEAPFKIEWDDGNNSVWNSQVTDNKKFAIENIPTGIYAVKVTDANGCVQMKNNVVVSANSNGTVLNATLSATNAPCGSSYGFINVDVVGTDPPYWITVKGPTSGTVQGQTNNTVIKNIPPGTYEVTVEKDGCSKTGWVTVGSDPGLDYVWQVANAACGGKGSFGITINGGEPTYTIEWWHKDGSSSWIQSPTASFVMDGMKSGEYTIKVTDKNGCWKSKKVVMEGGKLDFDLESTAATCGSAGSLWVTIHNGVANYSVDITGPGVNKWFEATNKSFPVNDLPAGQYTVAITDSKGCTNTKYIEVKNAGGNLDFDLESNAATCGSKGSIWVTINNGHANYSVDVTGPGVNKWFETSSKSFAVDGLPAGQYTVVITDSKGCTNTKYIEVKNAGGNLDFDLEATAAGCSEDGLIWVTIKNGSPKFTVEWWGPGLSKWGTTNSTSFSLKDLGPGEYTVKITDKNGCSNTKKIKVNDAGGNLDFALEANGATCSQKGSIWVTIKNGTANFSVDVTGPGVDRWFEATNASFPINDLPAGQYKVVITDKKGCSNTKYITVKDNGGILDFTSEATDAVCGGKGSIWVTIKNGKPKFIIELWGPNNSSFWAETSSSSFKLNQLTAGNYTLKITDKNGCSDTQYITVKDAGSDMGMTLEVNNASCTGDGRIWVTINGGTPHYNLRWTGPTIGEVNLSGNGYQINNLKAGNYTITVKDHYGCAYSKEVSVYSVGSNLTLALESNNATCNQNGYVWVTVGNGTGPYNVSWTGPASGSKTVSSAGFQIADLPAGNYTVNVKDKHGCTISKPVSVYKTGSDIGLSLEANNGSCGQNGYVWVTISNGTGPYHISWTGPQNGNANSASNGYQIGNLPNGTYQVTVKDKNGCSTYSQVSVSGSGMFTVSTQQTHASCGKNGEIWIDINGGKAPFKIKLSGPMVGSTTTSDYKYHFPSVPAGNYTLTIEDANGCIVTNPISILDNGGSIHATVEVSNGNCGQYGSAWVTASGGSSPYTVSWTGPYSASVSNVTSGYQITNLPAGDYTILVTDSYGCYTNKSITINNTGNSLTLSLGAQAASCGQKGAISATMGGGTSPYTLAWSGPSSGSIQTSNGSYQINNLHSGTYTVTLTDKNNCAISKAINVQDGGSSIGLTLTAIHGSCSAKGSIYAVISGGSAGYSYIWTGPTSGSVSSGSGAYRIDNLPAGYYTVTVRDVNGCESTQSITINNNGGTLGLTLAATDGSCSSKGSIYATISGGTAGYSYSWTGPTSGSVSSGDASYNITNLPAGYYLVTVRDVNGCEASQAVNVNDNGSTLGLTLAASHGSCNSKGSIYATISGGTGGYSYAWTGPSSGSVSSGDASYNITNLPAGDYSVTVRDANGCEATKTVTINNNGGSLGLTLAASHGACNAKGSILATISGGTAGYSYAWSGPVSGSVSSGDASYRIEQLPAGIYTITVRDVNGCEASKSVEVKNVGGALSVSLSSTAAVACEHEGSVLVSVGGGTAPYTIQYTGPSSATLQAGSNNYTVTNLDPGNYTFTVTDANGCSGTSKTTVYDNGSDLSMTLVSSAAACGSQGMITVNISGGVANYQITWSGGGVNGSVTTGNSSFALTDLPAGTYTVAVKDGIGCIKTETTVVGNGGESIGLQLVPSNDVCGQGGSIEVRINGGAAGYQIDWTGPINGSVTSNSNIYTITGLNVAGNYSVNVRDANGCEAKEWVAINTGGNVNFNVITTNEECNKGGELTVNITSGSPDYTVFWSGPNSGSRVISSNFTRIKDLGTGTYVVTVKDSKGCEDTQTIELGTNATIVGLGLTNTNTSCGAANGSITATVSNAATDYTISWSGPISGSTTTADATYTISDLSAGQYTIYIVDAKGCNASKSIEVYSSGSDLGLSAVGKNAACGQPSSIQVTISNGVPNFKIEWTGPTSGSINTASNSHTITDLADGDYIVRVTDYSGCSIAQAVVIKSNRNDVNFTYDSQAATCAAKGAIGLTITNGTGPFKISWTGPSAGSSTSSDGAVQITDLPAGTYAVTVEDKNGCVITQSIEVQNNGGSGTVNFAYKPGAVTCDKLGDILITMIDGTAPYTVDWTGPSSGTRTASTTDIIIENLTAGTYQVTVKGAGGCGSLSQAINVADNQVVLGVSGTVTNGVCGGKGSVYLSWSGDRDPYTITWTGTTTGSIAINSQSYTITDLPTGNYTFKVKGFDGCEGEYQAMVDNGGTAITADFSYTVSGKTLNFTNLSSAGTYLWDFGDNKTSSDMNPTHAYEKNGSYTICLKVTNSCGTKEKCRAVTINAATSQSSAKIVMGDKSGAKGSVIQLPVKVENCGRLATLSGTFMMGNHNVGTIMGLSPNAISPIYNDENHSFSYLAAGMGMDITDETILFYINVQLTGGIGQSSSIDLTTLPVALELTCTENGFSPPITPEVTSGKIRISSNQVALTDVLGSVLTYWGDGIPETMVTIRSIDHEMNPMTTIGGDYKASEVPMGYEYNIEPSKNTNPANGLSTYGLFLTQKYILGYKPEEIVSPYQVIAMDANCSGSLTTFDLFAMQQMLVGNLTEFPGCDSWVFVSEDHEFPEAFDNKNVFPYASSHTMMLDKEDAVADFIGIKVGDVLGRATPNSANGSTIATDRNRKVIPLQLSQGSAKIGETISLSFAAKDLQAMVSYQLGLDFDAQALDLVEFVPNQANELLTAKAGINRNQVKVSWYDKAGVGTTLEEAELFTLKFVAKQKIDDLLGAIHLNNRTFTSELHKNSNEAYRFNLEIANPKVTASDFKVHQNTPNPFYESTTIIVEMPNRLDAEILLNDHFGRTIQVIRQTLDQGVNQIKLNRSNLSSGVYYYTVKAGDFVDTKRMLIVE